MRGSDELSIPITMHLSSCNENASSRNFIVVVVVVVMKTIIVIIIADLRFSRLAIAHQNARRKSAKLLFRIPLGRIGRES